MNAQLVVFRLASDQYGVPISAVEAIIKPQAVTSIPLALDFVQGVTDLRGKVLPVIDLRRRFGLPVAEEAKGSRIVVVNAGGITLGMTVDEVMGVTQVMDEDVEPPSTVVANQDTAFITGIARAGEQLVIMLDLAKVLTDEQKGSLSSLPSAA